MKNVSAFIGGAGIGLLIGILIGMTTVSIVGIIMGTLTTILLAYLGNKEEGASDSKALRIGAFGLFGAIGILFGLYLRVNNAFLPSPSQQVSEWMKDSLFTKEEAKAYYIYDRFAFVPQGHTIDTTKAGQASTRAQTTVLYAGHTQQSDCEKLEEYENFTLADKLEAYRRLGGVWSRGVTNIKRLASSESEQLKMLELLKGLCDEQEP